MNEKWPTVSLGEVAGTRLGKTLPRGEGKTIGGQPYLRNVNVRWGRIDAENLNTMDFSRTEQEELSLLKGDVLVCEGGEVGRCALVEADMNGVFFQNAIHRVRVKDAVMPAFLAYTIEHIVKKGGLRGITSQVTIAHLNQAKLRNLQFSLPPLSEQRRMIDLIGALDDVIEAADVKTASLLHVSSALRTTVFADLMRTCPETTTGQFFDVTLGRQKSARQLYGDYEIPYLRSANISDGALSLADVQTMNFDPKEQAKYALRHGDVLVVEGGSIGQTAVWRGEIEGPVGFDKHVLRLRGLAEVSLSSFANQWARWCYETGRFEEQARGVTIKALGFQRAKDMVVPGASLARQQEAVALLDSPDTAAASSLEAANSLRVLRAQLLTALLTDAHRIPETYDELLGADMTKATAT